MCGREPFERRRFFCCHGNVWPELLELGRRYGWKPLGTLPDPDFWREKDTDKFVGTYDCDEDGKLLTDQDSKGLADALDRALGEMQDGGLKPIERPRSVLIRDDMTRTEYERANSGIDPRFLEQFI